MLQLKVFTSATRPANQQWGCHLPMKGGCVIFVGCVNISDWNQRGHRSTGSIKPNHTLLPYAIGAIANMVQMNISGWRPMGHCRTGSI